MSGLAARPEISITVPKSPSPANKTEDENEAALSEMAGLLVLWARARMREMPDKSLGRNRQNKKHRGAKDPRTKRRTLAFNAGE